MFSFLLSLSRWRIYGIIILSLSTLLTACNDSGRLRLPPFLNSRYHDEQPTLSGNGRFLAFVSNREGQRNVWLYDLEKKSWIDLPGFNHRDTITESPSISNNARYIVYIATDSGRPELELYDRLTHRTEILSVGFRGWIRHPSISPDGRYITFESSRRGQWDIEVIDRGPYIELDLLNGQSPNNSPSPSPSP